MAEKAVIIVGAGIGGMTAAIMTALRGAGDAAQWVEQMGILRWDLSIACRIVSWSIGKGTVFATTPSIQPSSPRS